MRSKRQSSQALSVPAGLRLSEDEIDEMIGNFAKEDDTRTKTFTRIIVEKFLSNVSCRYNLYIFEQGTHGHC